MRDLGLCKWNDFNKDVAGRNLYVFGAGARGARIAELINDHVYDWEITAFLDNSAKGTKLFQYDVLDPDVLKEKDPDSYVVLISILYPGIIASQLDELGVIHCYSYFYLTEGGRSFIKQDLSTKTEIQYLKNILCDEKSKYILDQLVKKRKLGSIDYSDITDTKSEYFRDEFFSHSDNEVFLDGGAFDGDTIDEFFDWTMGKYNEIYAFEADPKTAKLLTEKMHRWHNVHLIKKGLWDSNTTLNFSLDNKIISSHITSDTDQNSSCIECISFENQFGTDVPLSFIKLDIEGAEIQAINGMKNIIKKFHPKLAISIYHKPEDLWQIPLLIHELVPEYKLYIRHFGHNYFGTNVYATI